MGRKPNPAAIGGFVVGALALAIAGLVVFGGGRFFRSTLRWVAYFDESIKGLAVGAPVTFRGVRVGTVTDIKAVIDRQAKQIRTPVFFQIEADRITDAQGRKVRFLPEEPGAEVLIERGLRAQLEVQSFVTGQLAINLDFYPDAPVHLAGASPGYPEFPTVPSAMTSFRKRVEEIDLGELSGDLKDVLQGISRLVNSPEVKQVLVSAVESLEGVKKLAATADAKVASLGPALERSTLSINDTLETIQQLVRRVDSQTVPAVNETVRDAQQLVRRLDSQTVTAVNETVRDAQQVLRHVDAQTVPAVNQVLADLRPLVEEVGKTAGAARRALEQAQKALVSAESVMEDGSPLQYQMRLTLQEVAAAARAFSALSRYLERHPDAVLFGKDGKGGR